MNSNTTSYYYYYDSSTPGENVDKPEHGLIDDEVLGTANMVIEMFILTFALLGIITNIINIRVFVEQGVSNNNTNIGLLSLSVFDLFGCLFSLPYALCFLVGFVDGMMVARTVICQAYATVIGRQLFVFNNASSWVTVYLSTERAFCVVKPLKVKLFFRPKLTTIFIASTLVFFFALQLIYSANTWLVWEISPHLNQSIPHVEESAFARDYMSYVYNTIVGPILSSLAMVIVVVNTVIMSRKLIQIKKWRQSNASHSVVKHSDKPTLSSKDVELVKSVTTVTGVFLVCLSMTHFSAIVKLVIPGMHHTGVNVKLLYLVYIVRILFSAINSSINFFFYIRISSRYKAAFATVFPICAAPESSNGN